MNATKEALMRAMKAYFNGDTRRINHARKVTEYAEELLKREGGDRSIVIGAAVLHDIGIHQAQKKHGSTAGKHQEEEGPPIARGILDRLGFELGQIDEICDIIAHHHSPGKITTKNFAILYDADWLVNLKDEYDIRDRHKLSQTIERVFLTRSGKARAREIYLQENGGKKMYEKMLVPLDGSPLAECVLPHVEKLAKDCHMKEVILLRICEPPSIPSDYPASIPASWEEHVSQVTDYTQQQCRLYLGDMEKRLKDLGLKVRSESRLGNAVDEITDYASKNDVDLIIMASHGRSGISRWAYGSIADKVLRSTCVPVLMVKAPGCVLGI